MIHALITAILLAQPAERPPSGIELAKEYTAAAGDFVMVVAKTEGEDVLWIPKDDGLKPVPSDMLKDPKTYIAIAPKGRYRLLAVTTVGKKSQYAETVLIFGGGDVPPQPPPGPNPPPNPTPPADDLGMRLQKAYDLDQGHPAVKRGQVLTLSGLFEAMRDVAKKQTVTTLHQLLETMIKTRDDPPGIIPLTALTGVRKVISAELAIALGDDPGAAMTDALRVKADTTFLRISKALEGVK